MKKRILNALFMLILSVIWLFPYNTMHQAEWILTAGFFAAGLCIVLIGQRTVALCAAAAITAGMVIYDVRFLAGAALSVFVTALAYAAGEADAGKPINKDGYLFAVLLLCAGTAAGSVIYAFVSKDAFNSGFDRAYIWFVPAAAAAVTLLIKTFRSAPASGANKGRQARFPEAVAALYILLTVCMLAGVLASLRNFNSVRVWSYPAFFASVSAFTVPNPVTRGLFGKAAA